MENENNNLPEKTESGVQQVGENGVDLNQKLVELVESLSEKEVIRCAALMNEILKGKRNYEIMVEYSDAWGITMKTIGNYYLPLAKKLLKYELLNGEVEIYEDLLTKYNNLYKKAMANQDTKEAKTILDSIAKYTSIINQNGEVKTPPISTIRIIPGKADD